MYEAKNPDADSELPSPIFRTREFTSTPGYDARTLTRDRELQCKMC